MKKQQVKKRLDFIWLIAAGSFFSLVSLLVYRTVLSQLGMVYGLSVIPAIVVVMVMARVKIAGAKELINWAAPVNAVVTALTAIMSCSLMLDAFGYVVSGLYQFSQIKSYVIYAVIVVIAMTLNVVAGFTGLVEENLNSNRDDQKTWQWKCRFILPGLLYANS